MCICLEDLHTAVILLTDYELEIVQLLLLISIRLLSEQLMIFPALRQQHTIDSKLFLDHWLHAKTVNAMFYVRQAN